MEKNWKKRFIKKYQLLERYQIFLYQKNTNILAIY